MTSLDKWSARRNIYIPVSVRPDSGPWPPPRGLRDHTHWSYHTRYDYSVWVISPSHWPLPDNKQHNRHTSIPRRDSNPEAQKASVRRPTPSTARPPGSAIHGLLAIDIWWPGLHQHHNYQGQTPSHGSKQRLCFGPIVSALFNNHAICWDCIASSSSSSSSSSSLYSCHGDGPLVDPFCSHVSRSLFKGLPWFLLPVGE